MKAIVIVLIVQTSMIPLLIGSGYGIHKFLIKKPSTVPSTEPSTTPTTESSTTPTTESSTTPTTEHLTTPTTEPSTTPATTEPSTTPATTEPSTKPTAEPATKQYQWVNFTSELVNDSRLVNISGSVQRQYKVARMIYSNGDKIPIDSRINFEKKTIHAVIQTTSKYTIEVLLVESGHYKWIESSNGIVENNAIEGGNIRNETVYVCRLYHDKSWYGGVMQPSKGFCRDQYFKKNDRNYSLLVYEM